ncbi:N-6 DNA methylase [Muricoccus pecuniae]|uniref:site-specific DNA-methyltransferase (adenine-specific) n=1 Tax=Muricoccus pecuniae TaxID=693023 RepID=A0A840Y415_9PROT|nr:N-6 DNA methylase [Roseomonas pecuniae]MBB5693519.1 SAM-dependent methyltransferase [Roseomonas pecuniae]
MEATKRWVRHKGIAAPMRLARSRTVGDNSGRDSIIPVKKLAGMCGCNPLRPGRHLRCSLLPLLGRLTNRDAPRTEAEVQADIRQLLLSAPLQLHEDDLQTVHMESQLGDGRRIDIEVGSAVVEVKRDLRKGKVRVNAVQQLAGYVQTRGEQTGRRYVGILTDGAEWRCHHLVEGELREVSTLEASGGRADLDRLVAWLEGVLATAKDVRPTAGEIATRLGAGSSAHALDRATLSALYKASAERPTVKIKRALWSRLLQSALGTQFDDTDDLFIEHTLLVNSAEIIAHAVLGLPVDSIAPASLLSGSKFDESGIYGVVESDFFDWVLEVNGGQQFIRTLARRLGRFAWNAVDQDVLKVLYESVIGTETRKRLGEYYTPDWLAEAVVGAVLTAPLEQRVLDPACGSGTFLFHAARKYITEAEADGRQPADVLAGLTSRVFGMDLHPVAVTLARVTYLLAIGRERLMDPQRGAIHVPVFLGDALQWREQQLDLWTAGNLVIHADDQRELFPAELRFPDALLEDAPRFDRLVQEMAGRASAKKPGAAVPSLSALFQRLAIPEAARLELTNTFKIMCRLHDEGRDHIWGYYVRNLARPMWLAREANRVDVLVGNPPWLSFRHMTGDMQVAFKRMSESRRLWAGAEAATHQDLSALFVARAAQLYLKQGGRLGMVMPNGAMDREYYEGFRAGFYPDQAAPVSLRFGPSWDLRRIRPHFFPRGASVVFAHRGAAANPMPRKAEIWSGRLQRGNTTWSAAGPHLQRVEGEVTIADRALRSPYSPAFTQGAIMAPRLLFIVSSRQASPLGLQAGRMGVVSHRSANEKKPWKYMASVEGVVETEFVRPVYSGENLLPHRVTSPLRAVIPCTSERLLTERAEIEYYPGLDQWWRAAEECWVAHRSTKRLSLIEQLNYQNKLQKQLPVPPLRVVYNTSGMHIFAAKVADRRSLIASGLYWAAVADSEEADYLCAILNSEVTSDLVRPYLPYAKDERHIHKHIWQLIVPTYDRTDATHREVVALGREMARLAADYPVDSDLHFATTRGRMRSAMENTASGKRLGEIMYEMLS